MHLNKTLFMLRAAVWGFEDCLTVTRSPIVSEHSLLCYQGRGNGAVHSLAFGLY